jgi:hypothetical protein
VTGLHRRRRRRLGGLVALVPGALLVAACSSGAPPSPAASGAPSPESPAPAPGTAGFVIRASWTQALPPRSTFGNLPLLVVTTDGRVLTQGPVPEIYPGPLVAPVVERAISTKGVAALLGAAKDAGILRPDGDLTGGTMMPGAAAARLQVVVDGVVYDLVGDANAATPCPPTESCPAPVPGTPAAFATFWYRLLDMACWLEAELGPERVHEPAAYAVIVGGPPEAWPGAEPAVWPVTDPALDVFGAPVKGEPGTRCGMADGDLAVALRPIFAGATQLTPFVATASASATRGLTVRPLLPGDEDPCAPLVE